jgi:hypothetical protein
MAGEGLNLALFKPDIAVTSAGQIRKIQVNDFEGLCKLAEQASALPIPGGREGRGIHGERVFRTNHSVSCQPYTILNYFKVAEAGEPAFDRTSVYGFSKDAQVLEGGADLPDVLWELLGLVSEAPSGWDVEVDKSVLKSIEDMDN